MNSDRHETQGIARRAFLSRLSATAAASVIALGDRSHAEDSPLANDSSPSLLLPAISLGKHRVSRLVAGCNPILGYSYMGPIMDRHMREYFTPKQTVEFLLRCEREGINTHQFSYRDETGDILRTLRDRGSDMKLICLHAGEPDRISVKQVVKDTGPIAMIHHGGVTDRLFREGKSQEVLDFVKRTHDAGVLAGVSAHNPDCVKQVADEGWEVDLFMTCFYYLTRTPKELEGTSPVVTLQIGYPFFASDPAVMAKVVRQVDQPCLAFKILAAGRMCDSGQKVKAAFKFAFEHIKAKDGVIVGMYPRHSDQVRQNAQHVQEFGAV